MLVSITWSEYGVIILIALVVYYIVLLLLYYKDEVLRRFNKEELQNNNLSSKNNQSNQSDKGLSTFFHNQIEDDENLEFENSLNYQEDSKENHDGDKLIDEAQFTTSLHQVSQPDLFTSHQKYTPFVQETDDTLQQVQELTARLKETLAQGFDKNYIKEEFILSLQSLLKKYHFLKSSPFLVLINNMIASECEKYGYIQLSAEERVMLWNE